MTKARHMLDIIHFPLEADQAGLWFIGQSGFIIRAANKTVVIDPYLSDSVSELVPELTRLYPPPIDPKKLLADVFIVTHDHLDHLDPQTIGPFASKPQTLFVAPRLAAKKLLTLSVPEKNITVIDSGVTQRVHDIEITGVYTLPNDPAVIDTAGYKLTFANGRSVYHSSDTAFSELLLASAPSAEVALLCINGKSGNMDAAQAAQLAARIKPIYAISHHHDMFAFNSENPRAFGYQLKYIDAAIQTVVLEPMQAFVWNGVSKIS
ncbi:MAG: MBL fold metallo-hydrolase [Sedimentisphaerales bacterium]|nr:MBL fold metallo-hydrolase [Sedimentisphaerales bacterium]